MAKEKTNSETKKPSYQDMLAFTNDRETKEVSYYPENAREACEKIAPVIKDLEEIGSQIVLGRKKIKSHALEDHAIALELLRLEICNPSYKNEAAKQGVLEYFQQMLSLTPGAICAAYQWDLDVLAKPKILGQPNPFTGMIAQLNDVAKHLSNPEKIGENPQPVFVPSPKAPAHGYWVKAALATGAAAAVGLALSYLGKTDEKDPQSNDWQIKVTNSDAPNHRNR